MRPVAGEPRLGGGPQGAQDAVSGKIAGAFLEFRRAGVDIRVICPAEGEAPPRE